MHKDSSTCFSASDLCTAEDSRSISLLTMRAVNSIAAGDSLARYPQGFEVKDSHPQTVQDLHAIGNWTSQCYPLGQNREVLLIALQFPTFKHLSPNWA